MRRKEDFDMAEIKFEIVEKLGILAHGAKGWNKELNLISWNGSEPKYDIRDWHESHERMGKGTTLTKEELEGLKELLAKI